MGKGKRVRTTRKMRELAGLVRRLEGITLPDGTACPDCSRVVSDNEMVHDETCPAYSGRDSDRDREYFLVNPGAMSYTRPMTYAEKAEYKLLCGLGQLPCDIYGHVRVTKHEWGRTRQYVDVYAIPRSDRV